MYYLITIINIVAGIVAMTLLVNMSFEFLLHRKWQRYMWWKCVSLAYMLAVNVYTLAEPSGNWKLKLVHVFWWGPTFLFIDALRSSSLKKKGDERDIRYTTENDKK